LRKGTCTRSRLVKAKSANLNRTSAPRRPAVLVLARYGLQRGSPEISDRLIGAVTYILPFLNAFVYARFLYMAVPVVRAGEKPNRCPSFSLRLSSSSSLPSTCVALKPIMPVITTYSSIPLGSLIVFFALYLGVVNNKNMSRFVR
jgi:hypothetical protein